MSFSRGVCVAAELLIASDRPSKVAQQVKTQGREKSPWKEARQKDRPELKPQDGKGQWEAVLAAPRAPARRQQCLWMEPGLSCSLGLSCLKQLLPVHLTFKVSPKVVVPKEPFLPSRGEA